MLYGIDELISLNAKEPGETKDQPPDFVNSNASHFQHQSLPKDSELFRPFDRTMQPNTIKSVSHSLPEQPSGFISFNHAQQDSGYGTFLEKAQSLESFPFSSSETHLSTGSTHSDTVGFGSLGAKPDNQSQKLGRFFRRLGTPINPNFIQSDHTQMALDNPPENAVIATEYTNAKRVTESFEVSTTFSSQEFPTLNQSCKLPTPNALSGNPLLGSQQVVGVEGLSQLKMPQMKRENSWASVESRLFGESQESNNMLRPPSSASSEHSYASVDHYTCLEFPQLDHSNVGGSFSKLLNTMSWLASMEHSCRQFQKDIRRNYSSSNLSTSTINDTNVRNFVKPSPPSYSVNYMETRQVVPSDNHLVYTPTITPLNTRPPNFHAGFNEHSNLDNFVSIDNDFRMESSKWSIPHLSPSTMNSKTHNDMSGRSTAAQSNVGTTENKQKSYRGKYFFNYRVVNGVEQEVYDLDVDLGITVPRNPR